jgi:parallel beta-helix repeat protein
MDGGVGSILTIADAAPVVVPVSGVAFAAFTVTLSPANLQNTVTVDYTTVNGTAVAGVDYVATHGTLTFPPDQTQETIDVPILPNTVAAPEKTFTVVLSNPSPPDQVTISTGTATGTIINPLLVTNTNDSGLGSLRRAIQTADAINALVAPSSPVVIRFDIPGSAPFVIKPLSALPPITGPTVVDATSQPGYQSSPVVVLDGSSLSSESISAGLTNGLVIQPPSRVITGVRPAGSVGGTGTGPATGGSTVLGLAVVRFPGAGIVLQGVNGNVVQKDDLGTDPYETASSGSAGNGNSGLLVVASAANLIGGPAGSQGNVISGNGQVGVYITGAGSSGNVLLGNKIGTDAAGTAALPNGLTGLWIAGAAGNTAFGNVISGNGVLGVEIAGAGSSGNVLLGNKIGTDVSGTTAVRNGLTGVLITSAGHNTVGGTAGSSGNVISGNGTSGVAVQGAGASGNAVQGNRIGTDASGTHALPNGLYGVILDGAPANLVGGSGAGAGNVISGNGQVGVEVLGASASGNTIAGNKIGTDVSGLTALPNGLDGVFLVDTSHNVVGGASGSGNVISGNGQVGLQIFGADSTGNVVQGNTIGGNVRGTAALGNGLDGVFVNAAPGNAIVGNLISGNGSVGLQILGTSATGNRVQGNTIGADLAGTAALGNGLDGVFVNAAPGNAIVGNLISGNGSVGVQLLGASATGNSLLGNTIGADVTGLAALPNRVDGVFVNGAPRNAIVGNLISGNGSAGLHVFGRGSSGETVLNNRIGVNANGAPRLGNAYGVFIDGAPPIATVPLGPSPFNNIAGNRVAQVFQAPNPGASTAAGTLSTANARPQRRSHRG